MKFPKYLQHLVDSDKYRLVDLSHQSGINSPDLSKLVRGKRSCGAKAMAQILGGLNEEHRSQALMAWLDDQLPQEYKSLVHIMRADGDAKQNEPPDIGTIEGSIEVLAAQAEANDAVRVVLRNLAAAFTGVP
ncbi:MAG: hypothetical protein V4819_16360 [Verrucomicrobiota bacterium]